MAATHKCLVCSCSLDEGDNLRRRRRLDKCSQDLKNYMEMIELEHGSYDDPTYACRTCFSDIEKGAKTAVALRSINTRLRSSAGITATDMSVDEDVTSGHGNEEIVDDQETDNFEGIIIVCCVSCDMT